MNGKRTPRELLLDPEFYSVPKELRRQALATVWPEFASASMEDQDQVLDYPSHAWAQVLTQPPPPKEEKVVGFFDKLKKMIGLGGEESKPERVSQPAMATEAVEATQVAPRGGLKLLPSHQVGRRITASLPPPPQPVMGKYGITASIQRTDVGGVEPASDKYGITAGAAAELPPPPEVGAEIKEPEKPAWMRVGAALEKGITAGTTLGAAFSKYAPIRTVSKAVFAPLVPESYWKELEKFEAKSTPEQAAQFIGELVGETPWYVAMGYVMPSLILPRALTKLGNIGRAIGILKSMPAARTTIRAMRAEGLSTAEIAQWGESLSRYSAGIGRYIEGLTARLAGVAEGKVAAMAGEQAAAKAIPHLARVAADSKAMSDAVALALKSPRLSTFVSQMSHALPVGATMAFVSGVKEFNADRDPIKAAAHSFLLAGLAETIKLAPVISKIPEIGKVTIPDAKVDDLIKKMAQGATGTIDSDLMRTMKFQFDNFVRGHLEKAPGTALQSAIAYGLASSGLTAISTPGDVTQRLMAAGSDGFSTFLMVGAFHIPSIVKAIRIARPNVNLNSPTEMAAVWSTLSAKDKALALQRMTPEEAARLREEAQRYTVAPPKALPPAPGVHGIEGGFFYRPPEKPGELGAYIPGERGGLPPRKEVTIVGKALTPPPQPKMPGEAPPPILPESLAGAQPLNPEKPEAGFIDPQVKMHYDLLTKGMFGASVSREPVFSALGKNGVNARVLAKLKSDPLFERVFRLGLDHLDQFEMRMLRRRLGIEETLPVPDVYKPQPKLLKSADILPVMGPARLLFDLGPSGLERPKPRAWDRQLLSGLQEDRLRSDRILGEAVEDAIVGVGGDPSRTGNARPSQMTLFPLIRASRTRNQPSGESPGATVTVPTWTYQDGVNIRSKDVGAIDRNIWVKQAKEPENSNRILLIQFSDSLISGDTAPEATQYFDALYNMRAGYDRPADFWEIPQWQAAIKYNIPEADHYIVRDIDEAVKFLNAAGYKTVAFSAMDANASLIHRIAQDYKGDIAIGGYTDLGQFSKYPNVKTFDSVEQFVKSQNKPYAEGYDYSGFNGTKTVPRLTLSTGCLHSCAFCMQPREIVESPKETIIQQAESIATNFNPRLIYINDKTFGQAANYTMLPELYIAIKRKAPNFEGFVIQTTAAQMRKLTPEFINNAHIKYIELGLESYNDNILKEVHKPANEKLIQEAADKIRQTDAILIPNIMVGLPGETAETYDRTLKWLRSNSDIISHVNVYNLVPYYQTEIAKRLKAQTARDFDENSPRKSWMDDPSVHENAYRDIIYFGRTMLGRDPQTVKLLAESLYGIPGQNIIEDPHGSPQAEGSKVVVVSTKVEGRQPAPLQVMLERHREFLSKQGVQPGDSTLPVLADLGVSHTILEPMGFGTWSTVEPNMHILVTDRDNSMGLAIASLMGKGGAQQAASVRITDPKAPNFVGLYLEKPDKSPFSVAEIEKMALTAQVPFETNPGRTRINFNDYERFDRGFVDRVIQTVRPLGFTEHDLRAYKGESYLVEAGEYDRYLEVLRDRARAIGRPDLPDRAVSDMQATIESLYGPRVEERITGQEYAKRRNRLVLNESLREESVDKALGPGKLPAYEESIPGGTEVSLRGGLPRWRELAEALPSGSLPPPIWRGSPTATRADFPGIALKRLAASVQTDPNNVNDIGMARLIARDFLVNAEDVFVKNGDVKIITNGKFIDGATVASKDFVNRLVRPDEMDKKWFGGTHIQSLMQWLTDMSDEITSALNIEGSLFFGINPSPQIYGVNLDISHVYKKPTPSLVLVNPFESFIHATKVASHGYIKQEDIPTFVTAHLFETMLEEHLHLHYSHSNADIDRLRGFFTGQLLNVWDSLIDRYAKRLMEDSDGKLLFWFIQKSLEYAYDTGDFRGMMRAGIAYKKFSQASVADQYAEAQLLGSVEADNRRSKMLKALVTPDGKPRPATLGDLIGEFRKKDDEDALVQYVKRIGIVDTVADLIFRGGEITSFDKAYRAFVEHPSANRYGKVTKSEFKEIWSAAQMQAAMKIPGLTMEERELLTAADVVRIKDVVTKYEPELDRLERLSVAGAVTKGWYQRMNRVINMISPVLPGPFDPAIKTRIFINLIGSLSPRTPVKKNVLLAMRVWRIWADPSKVITEYPDVELAPDVVPFETRLDKLNTLIVPSERSYVQDANGNWIPEVVRDERGKIVYEIDPDTGDKKPIPVYRKKGTLELSSHVPNVITTLSTLGAGELSGYKVNSFVHNLFLHGNYVTFDAHEANALNAPLLPLDRKSAYFGMTSLVRRAAQNLGMLPFNTQETSWCVIRALLLLYNKNIRPIDKAIQLLTPRYLRELTANAEIVELLLEDPDVRVAMEDLGIYNGIRKIASDIKATSNLGRDLSAAKKIDPRILEPVAERIERTFSDRATGKAAERRKRGLPVIEETEDGQLSLFTPASEVKPEDFPFGELAPEKPEGEGGPEVEARLTEKAAQKTRIPEVLKKLPKTVRASQFGFVMKDLDPSELAAGLIAPDGKVVEVGLHNQAVSQALNLNPRETAQYLESILAYYGYIRIRSARGGHTPHALGIEVFVPPTEAQLRSAATLASRLRYPAIWEITNPLSREIISCGMSLPELNRSVDFFFKDVNPKTLPKYILENASNPQAFYPPISEAEIARWRDIDKSMSTIPIPSDERLISRLISTQKIHLLDLPNMDIANEWEYRYDDPGQFFITRRGSIEKPRISPSKTMIDNLGKHLERPEHITALRDPILAINGYALGTVVQAENGYLTDISVYGPVGPLTMMTIDNIYHSSPQSEGSFFRYRIIDPLSGSVLDTGRNSRDLEKKLRKIYGTMSHHDLLQQISLLGRWPKSTEELQTQTIPGVETRPAKPPTTPSLPPPPIMLRPGRQAAGAQLPSTPQQAGAQAAVRPQPPAPTVPGGPGVPGTPAVPGVPGAGIPTPPQRTPIEELRDIFTKPPKESAITRVIRGIKKAPRVIQSKSTSEFQPVAMMERAIRKEANLPPVEWAYDAASVCESMYGAAAKAEADVRVFEDIIRPIKDHAEMFNYFMFLVRTRDRLYTDPINRKVGDWTLDKVDKYLKALENEVGPDVFREFQKIGLGYVDQNGQFVPGAYQTVMDEALRWQVYSGRLSKDAYDAIKAKNDIYAPFAVLKYLDPEFEDARTGGPVNTRSIATRAQLTYAIRGIDDPDFRLDNILHQSAAQIYRSRILAEKNLVMLKIAELADLDKTGKYASEVEGPVLITPDSPGQKPVWMIPGKGRVPPDKGVLPFLRDGKRVALIVPKDVAEAVQRMNYAQADWMVKFLGSTAGLMRMGATTYNISFQAVNAILDATRLAIFSKYGIRGPIDALRFLPEWIYGFASALSGNLAGGNELYRRGLITGILNSSYQRVISPEAFERHRRLGIKPEKGVAAKAKVGFRIAAAIANTFEEATKLTGLLRAWRFEKISQLSPQQQEKILQKVRIELRRYGGSPDFSRSTPDMRRFSLMFMFANAKLQDMSSDLARLAFVGGDISTSLAVWTRIFIMSMPLIGLALLNASDEYARDYDDVPPFERDNYIMVPLDKFFTDDDGKRIREYVKVPKRGLFQAMDNIINDAVRYSRNLDPDGIRRAVSHFFEAYLPVSIEGRNLAERAESVVSSLNPALRAPLEMIFNRDTFRHRPIVPERLERLPAREQFRSTTPEFWKTLGQTIGVSPIRLQQLANTLSAGLITQFAPNKPVGDRPAWTEYPVLRRFVRSSFISDELAASQLAQMVNADQTEGAIRERLAESWWENLKAKPESERLRFLARVKREDPLFGRALQKVMTEAKKGLTYEDRQISRLSVTDGTRARYIFMRAQRMRTDEEREQWLKSLKQKRILTPNVQMQLNRLKSGKEALPIPPGAFKEIGREYGLPVPPE